MTDLTTVAVLGSCITRDNFNRRFNPDYKQWYAVGPTTNQSSMIALMSPPVDEPWEPLAEMKPYGRWNVASDLSREILTLLPAERPDLVVLDFFGDVHFGVLRMPDGRYVTDNRWRLRKTDLYGRLMADPGTVAVRWQDDPDAYFALWTEAMDRFAAHVAEHCPDSRVVVHCGFNAVDVLRAGQDVPTPLGPPGRKGKPARVGIRRGNRFWARLNEHARTAYGWDHVDLSRERFATFADHPWGPFEVHYTMDYYRRFQAELHRVVLREQLPAELAARVDAVAEASARRIQVELGAAPPEEEAAAPRWRRLLGRSPRDAGLTADRRLLESLRGDLDEDAWTRVAQLPESADERIAWLRAVREAQEAQEARERVTPAAEPPG